MLDTENLLTDALQCVETLGRRRTHNGLSRDLHTYLSRYGYEYTTICAIPEGIETARDTMLLNTRPEAYVEQYIEEDHQPHDPVVNALHSSSYNYTWEEVVHVPEYRTARSDYVVGAGGDYNMRNGIVVPVYGLSGKMGFSSICGFEPDTQTGTRSALSIVGMFAFQTLLRLEAENRRKTPGLSPRELDVLAYAANGLTDIAIAEKLGIAENTVEFHMRGARTKLNAPNRTAAVVAAMKTGELRV
ncbi:MAG: autoinducer binding domain-containing protein [Devosiaceae bacterium]|nr:autoinducer binding domain-containing protein [Devosiaceae bacterium MH13]